MEDETDKASRAPGCLPVIPPGWFDVSFGFQSYRKKPKVFAWKPRRESD